MASKCDSTVPICLVSYFLFRIKLRLMFLVDVRCYFGGIFLHYFINIIKYFVASLGVVVVVVVGVRYFVVFML